MFTMVRRLWSCFCLIFLPFFKIGTLGDEVAWGGPGVSGGFGERESNRSILLEWYVLSINRESSDVSDRVSNDSNRQWA